MSAVAVRALLRSHPEKPAHACTTCADACLSERDVGSLVPCIRLNLDCAAACQATGSILSRSNKTGHRQLLEAQLATCIAFCRACAAECAEHAEMHGHCRVCAEACTACASACNAMLTAMRLPA
jgi:hypothetical protein